MANIGTSGDGPKLTPLGRAFIFIFIIGCIVGAYFLFVGKKSFESTKNAASSILGGGPPVEIGVAYGTEKQRWLEWAVNEFGKTSDGKHIKVNLIPMGSLEGAHAILSGDQRINVWSPASTTTIRLSAKSQSRSRPWYLWSGTSATRRSSRSTKRCRCRR